MSHRVPESCVYRRVQADSLRCDLISDLLTGLQSDAPDSRSSQSDPGCIGSDICEACCRSFLPTRFDLNPVVASIIWARCDEALSSPAAPQEGERARKLYELRNLAESSLPFVLDDEDDLPAQPQTAEHRPRGTVADLLSMIPVPDSGGRTLTSWAVGVTTAPRRQPTLERCLNSLRHCGWEEIHLFVDGEVSIPDAFQNSPRTVRIPAAGAWRNFFLSISELLRRHPAASAVLICQDDALWPAHMPARDYLEQIPWPEHGRFLISPYCCADYTASTPGWHEFRDQWRYGAVSLIFSRESAEEFLSDPSVIARCRNEWQAGIDDVVGEWAIRTQTPVLFPTPSLVQHIGEVSTLWSTARAVGLRRAAVYVGDEVRLPQWPQVKLRSILCGWLSSDPPIVYHSMGSEDPGHFMPDEPITRLAMYLWNHTAAEIVELDRRARELRPAHRIHHLVNDASTARDLATQGLSAHFINQNAFLDEQLFQIRDNVPVIYDAVYNGRMVPFKRHELAAQVSRLLVIGGTHSEGDSHEYLEHIRAMLPHAVFTHATGQEFFDEQAVCGFLNQARVGLCLSAEEGAMYAATEYLLCGLPVVSTVSVGGRDTWFDSRFTRIVPDDPAAVAAAVQELISLKIPAETVRTETLLRMWEHRRRFLDLGQTIFAANHSGRDFSREFWARFRNKLGEWCMPQDIMRLRRRF